MSLLETPSIIGHDEPFRHLEFCPPDRRACAHKESLGVPHCETVFLANPAVTATMGGAQELKPLYGLWQSRIGDGSEALTKSINIEVAQRDSSDGRTDDLGELQL